MTDYAQRDCQLAGFGSANAMRRVFCKASFFAVKTKHARLVIEIHKSQPVPGNVRLIHALQQTEKGARSRVARQQNTSRSGDNGIGFISLRPGMLHALENTNGFPAVTLLQRRGELAQ